MKPYGIIYIVTNLKNGRFYVGQTKRTVAHRWAVHKSEAKNRPGCYFHKAIRKNGPDSFDVQEVASADSRFELDRLEKAWIIVTDALRSGYNLRSGGEGSQHTAEVIERIAAKHRGRSLSEDHKRKLSESTKGRPKTEQHRANISKGLMGRLTTQRTRDAVAAANRRRAKK
jgi:group I intron endonuclease